MKKENILGFDVCNTSMINLINDIFSDYDNGISNFIVNINPEIIVNNYRNYKLKQKFNSQQYQIPDGIGIIIASKMLHRKMQERITGIDLMKLICEKSVNHDSRIFLYGSKAGIADKAKKELELEYPNINIVGACNGYEEEISVIKQINDSNASILFVGLGSPKQEEFIIKNKEKLYNIKIFMPVGGSLDVISKTLKRAPNWIIKINLEWLYRLFQEPKRFFRQLKLIKFIFLIIFRRNLNEKN